jgi:hypothetical protein
MEDTQLYAMVLGIKFPCRITKVQGDMKAQRVDVWIEEAAGMKVTYAVCKREALVYDHTENRCGGAWTPVSARRSCTPVCREHTVLVMG